MPVPTEYIARETASNLWRNRLMTFAAVLTVAVSLTLVGATLVLKQGAAQAEVDWQRGTQVTVWMKPHATSSETKAIGTQLHTLSYVQGCVFRGHQYDYNEAVRLLGTTYKQANVTPAGTPTSWRCTPHRLQDATAVVNKFKGQPGVQSVLTPKQQIHNEEEVINILQIVFLVVAAVLLISAAVLILNTIRMAIFARRREVSVMKLVGATNWFIRLPFMSEGLVQGLLGSGVAAGVVYALHVVLNDLGNPATHPAGSLLTQMRLTGWDMFITDAVIVVVGMLIGTMGSALAIRRFLDV
ncbi:MAG: cell division protein FtsX [Acidimicrobiales bacterium]